MKNLKIHATLSLFIMLILYSLLSQIELELSFIGNLIAFIITTLFAVFYLWEQKTGVKKFSFLFLSFFLFHWLAIVIFFIYPSLLALVLSIFCLGLRELIFTWQNSKQNKTRHSLFFILSILKPPREMQNRIFHAYLVIFSAWISLLLQYVKVVPVSFIYFPFIVFSICFSSQILRDICAEGCQYSKLSEVNDDGT